MNSPVQRYMFPGVLTIVLILVLLAIFLVNLEIQPTTENVAHKSTGEEHEETTQLVSEQQPSDTTTPKTTLSVKTVPVYTRTSTQTPTITPTPTDAPTPTYTSTPTLTPTPSITPTPTPRPPSIEILVNELEVRQGPGQHFPVLYTVRKGAILIVQSKNINFDDSPWFLIRIRPDGTEEWISGDEKLVKRHNVASLSYRAEPSPPVPGPSSSTGHTGPCSREPQGDFARLWRSHRDWFGCPIETNPLLGQVSELPFEKGHLFWLGNIDEYGEIRLVIVTFGGQNEGDTGTWSHQQEDWNGEGICNVPTPPEGLFLPDKGLAKVWCEIDGLSHLGYATSPSEFVPNRGIDAIQNFDRAVIFRDSDGHTKDLVYVLFREDNSYVRVKYK
jgi:hypothetical protein